MKHDFSLPHRKWSGTMCSLCGKPRGHLNHSRDYHATVYDDEPGRTGDQTLRSQLADEHADHKPSEPRDLTKLPVSEWTDAEVRGYAAFTIESVAHLRNMEELLPIAERLRAMK